MIDHFMLIGIQQSPRRKKYKQLKQLRQWRDAALKSRTQKEQIEALKNCIHVVDFDFMLLGPAYTCFTELIDGTVLYNRLEWQSGVIRDAILNVYKTMAKKYLQK